MKKSYLIVMMVLALVASPVLAATDDFVANGNFTIEGVMKGIVPVDLLLFSGSSCETYSVIAGEFLVTNPGLTFQVGSVDATVKSVEVTLADEVVACQENSVPGTSFVDLPDGAGVYEVIPSDSDDCTAYCDPIDHALSYDDFPSCQAISCGDGWFVKDGVCAPVNRGGSGSSWSQTQEPPTATTTATTTTETTTATTTTETTTDGIGTGLTEREIQLKAILAEARIVFESMNGPEAIAYLMNMQVNEGAYSEYLNKYTKPISAGLFLSQEALDAITYFILYGTPTTRHLGAGERAGVVNSYKAAFGKLPQIETEWQDVIKIANGRWPSERSEMAENRAKEMFKKIYLRDSNMNQANDNAAVTVMAYGLRPSARNMNSEKAAILIFKGIFKYAPSSATDWDAVRAIAYSGAIR